MFCFFLGLGIKYDQLGCVQMKGSYEKNNPQSQLSQTNKRYFKSRSSLAQQEWKDQYRPTPETGSEYVVYAYVKNVWKQTV